MTNTLPALAQPRFHDEIADLAQAYRRANGPLMRLLNRFGNSLEKQMALLPPGVQPQLDRAVVVALTAAHGVAGLAEDGPDLGRTGGMAAALATGAAGGAGGFATSLIEMPVTITVFLHAIRREAIAAGYDPHESGIRAACLEVFASGSPLARDDGVNTAFLSARMTFSAPAIQKLIATVAPRLAAAMGQKLALQALPVIGALTGAALNAAYLNYYRELARIRFALMRLTETHSGEAVVAAFSRAVGPARVGKA